MSEGVVWVTASYLTFVGDIPWFHGINNTFSLSLVCPKAFFVLILI